MLGAIERVNSTFGLPTASNDTLLEVLKQMQSVRFAFEIDNNRTNETIRQFKYRVQPIVEMLEVMRVYFCITKQS